MDQQRPQPSVHDGSPILHITPEDRWNRAVADDTDYRDPSLDTEGFIHCSTPAQVLLPANALFRGQRGLVLLVVDPSRLDTHPVFEDCYESGIAFPHIYGPIPRTAVTDVVAFDPLPDGTFALPAALAHLATANLVDPA